MTAASPNNRRRAYRLQTYLPATFSLCGGSDIPGHVIDLTHRSIALHGPSCAREGDAVSVGIGPLPRFTGRVARSFRGGFALKLDRISIALVAYAKTRRDWHFPPLSYSTDRLISPPFCIGAAFPAWGRLAASCRSQGRSERHYLSLVYVDGPAPEEIAAARLTSDEMTWLPHVALAGRRGEEAVLVFILNGWQLENAAASGLQIKAALEDGTVSVLDIPVDALGGHMMAHQPRKLQNQLLSKRPATAESLSTISGSRASGGVITA